MLPTFATNPARILSLSCKGCSQRPYAALKPWIRLTIIVVPPARLVVQPSKREEEAEKLSVVPEKSVRRMHGMGV